MSTALRTLIAALLLGALLGGAPTADAQTYDFSVEQSIVDVFFEQDGSARVEYQLTFRNNPGGSPIDFVDIGMPTPRYSLNNVHAWIDDNPISDISSSPYVENGFALGLGGAAIAAGQTGTVKVVVIGIEDMLYTADEPEGYASARFSPTWFDSQFVTGSTPMRVTFHLPPGVQPEEPRYYPVEGGWPDGPPEAGLDADGRVLYSWYNPAADASRQYVFGAGFPAALVPASALSTPGAASLSFDWSNLITPLCCGGFALFFIGTTVLGARTANRRKLAYLPPKIAIEGHGIKRGLSAVEAAILLETPLDRVLTMILFSLIKKNAARVLSEKPLQVERIKPAPEGLRDYEISYLAAIIEKEARPRQKALEQVMVDLVKAVQGKMKGFSLKETREYYKSIVQKAWQQVEQADTPEVKSERYAENLEWEMLDGEFDKRTRRTMTGPVYVPAWWGNYHPAGSAAGGGGGGGTAARPASLPRGSVSLPHLPGSDFAASMVNSVQTVAGGLVANVQSFTGRVTQTTNPPPPPSRSASSSGRSGGGCACACACAGCACACAGGGR
jgi:hypothetical protein